MAFNFSSIGRVKKNFLIQDTQSNRGRDR